jgi:hypothetical protein
MSSSDAALKLHLRYVTLGRRVVRVVTLRPSIEARFSTNLFHNTWHILAGGSGAGVLARLLWGLSFQRQPSTFVVIDRAHVVTTPFDGDDGDMILFGRMDDALDGDVLRAIKFRLRRVPRVDKTIRFHTFGLEGADVKWPEKAHEEVTRLGGFVCYRTTTDMLRVRARTAHSMRRCAEMDYCFLGEARRYAHASGEIQIFRHFDDMVSSARVARRAIIGERAIGDEGERERVQSEAVRRKKLLWNARDTLDRG